MAVKRCRLATLDCRDQVRRTRRTLESGDAMARGDSRHRLGPFRDPNVDSAVLDSTRRLLVERGYRDTSVDAIAEAAGVSRPTIYRRWPSKAHVEIGRASCRERGRARGAAGARQTQATN